MTAEVKGYEAATNRADFGWDIWGQKYTLMGLLLHHEATGNADSLTGARRLADYLMERFGPDKADLATAGG